MSEKSADLLFVPLGGAGEIGMNLNLYGWGRGDDRDWLMIDLGITFGDDKTPGIDVLMPDTAFIEERYERLAGLVLTHAHEDHIGAVPYLWERLQCPVYGSPFTLSVLRRKLAEEGMEGVVPLHQVPLSGHFDVGPFDLEMITLTHSIPEPNAIVLRTPAGTVLHTGDWRLDPNPVIGQRAEEETLRALGDAGVHAIVCDSTNVFEDSSSGSESDLLAGLTEAIAGCGTGRVAVGCFASNIGRLETIAAAAAANGRSVVLAGRSLRRMYEAALENDYLTEIPAFLGEEDAEHLPKDNLLIICTGSQGEPRAALTRLAEGAHPRLQLDKGDTVIFSSRVIPGNERAIGRVHNLLSRRGVDIITQKDSFVHVSGHPARDEMAAMYRLVRPRICVPVHGEARHLDEHARLAQTCGVEHTVIVENGSVVRLGPGDASIVDQVPVGRLAVEGNRLVPLGGILQQSRNKALYGGAATVTVVLDAKGRLMVEPQVSVVGLLDEDEEEPLVAVRSEVETALAGLSGTRKADDDAVREAVRLAVRRSFRKTVGKKPVTQVHLVRL